MKYLITIILLSMLSACGGGGDGPAETVPAAQPAPAAAPAVAAPLAQRKATVTMYGDSVQLGFAGNSIASYAQPLVADIAELRVSAVAGSIAYNLAMGVGVSVWPAGLLKTKQADIISANFGINDTYGLGLYELYLRQIVADANAVGSRVILQTPNPVTDNLHGDVSSRAIVMRQVAADTGAVLCDHEADSIMRGLQTQLIEGPVGAHPNPTQYKFMGALFAKCVRSALGRPDGNQT